MLPVPLAIVTPLELLVSDPAEFVMLALALVLAIALHEFAHALVADLQGDRLPRAMGRLTLNPLAHLDPVGTILLVLVGFGWGKPVEFRPSALRSRRFGGALVALAGPVMNLLLAVIAAVGLAAALRGGTPSQLTLHFLADFMSINVILAVFNLLPLPPLDGSRLLTILLPPSRQHIVYFLDRYGFVILLIVVLIGGIRFLEPIIGWVTDVVLRIAGIA